VNCWALAASSFSQRACDAVRRKIARSRPSGQPSWRVECAVRPNQFATRRGKGDANHRAEIAPTRHFCSSLETRAFHFFVVKKIFVRDEK
jgi:hypothetical protein